MSTTVAIHNSLIKTPLDWSKAELQVFLHSLIHAETAIDRGDSLEVSFDRKEFVDFWSGGTSTSTAYETLINGLERLVGRRFYRTRDTRGLQVFNLIARIDSLKGERDVSILFTPDGADVVKGLKEKGDFTLIDLKKMSKLNSRNAIIFYLHYVRIGRMSRSDTFFVGYNELRNYLGFVSDKKIGIKEDKYEDRRVFTYRILKKISEDFKATLGVDLTYRHDKKRDQIFFSYKDQQSIKKPAKPRVNAKLRRANYSLWEANAKEVARRMAAMNSH